MKNASVKHIEIDTHIQTVREDRLRALKHRPSYLRKSQKHQYVSCNPSPRPLWTWVPRIPCSHHFPVAMVTGRWVVFLPGPQLLQLLGVHVDLVHERPSPVVRPLPAVSVRWGVGPGVHCVLIGRRPRSGGRVLPRSNIIIWIFVLFIVMMFLVGTWIAAWIGVIISSVGIFVISNFEIVWLYAPVPQVIGLDRDRWWLFFHPGWRPVLLQWGMMGWCGGCGGLIDWGWNDWGW